MSVFASVLFIQPSGEVCSWVATEQHTSVVITAAACLALRASFSYGVDEWTRNRSWEDGGAKAISFEGEAWQGKISRGRDVIAGLGSPHAK